MSLQETISKEIITAMKNKDRERMDALRYLKSLFIQNNTSTKPIDDLSIVIGHVKKLQESLVNFPEGSELNTKTKAEIGVIMQYMPQPLKELEVKQLIDQIKVKLGKPNMGEIMKELTPQIKGRFDGKLASDLVKAALSS